MLFSKQDYEYLLNSLSKKFTLYEFIDNNYLSNMLDNLMSNGCFEDLKISSEALSKDMNPLFNISFRIQNYLYYKICKLAEEDIDVLLTLVEDKRKIVILVFRKLKIDDFSKVDDYIMEIVSLYNGVESFDSFVTRYVMSAIKGVKFEVERVPIVCSTKEMDKADKKKKKNKNKVKKNKDGSIFCDSTKSDKVKIHEVSYYDRIVQKCNLYKGSALKDNFIEMVLKCDLINEISFVDNEYYRVYFLMRYGLINETYYSIEEVSRICDISLEDVLSYERLTVEYLRNYLNRLVSDYEKHLLIKSV